MATREGCWPWLALGMPGPRLRAVGGFGVPVTRRGLMVCLPESLSSECQRGSEETIEGQ